MSSANSKGSEPSFDPTKPTLIIGGVIFVLAAILSSFFLLPDTDKFFAEQEEAKLAAQSLAKAEEEAEKQAEKEEKEKDKDGKKKSESEKKKAKETKPKLSSATVFSWGNDEGDHPELAAALLDGDKSTVWRSRYFEYEEFDENNRIALLLKLEEPAVVSEITIQAIGEGGELVVRSSPDENPRKGKVLATVPIDGKTVVKLAQPTEVKALGLSFKSLPTDDEGLLRAKIWNITVE